MTNGLRRGGGECDSYCDLYQQSEIVIKNEVTGGKRMKTKWWLKETRRHKSPVNKPSITSLTHNAFLN